MKIEELLNCPNPADLEKLTDQQLNEWFNPLLPKTRPDMALKEKASSVMHSSRQVKSKKLQEQLEFNTKYEEAKRLAATLGIHLK